MRMKVNVRVETDNEKGRSEKNKLIRHRMKEINHTLRAILSNPTREALAGAINGVAGAVVGAEADLSAGPPIPATWTDCKSPKANHQNNP